MTALQQLALALTVVNFAIFAVGTWTVFRHSRENKRWNGFGIIWVATTAAIIYGEATRPQPSNSLLFVGLALLLVSLGLFFLTSRTVRKLERRLTSIFSRDVPQSLIEEGPFRYVRHPFYTSYLLSYAAVAILAKHWATYLAAVTMLLAYVVAAHLEEDKFSQSSCADDYRRYRERAGMFFPKWSWR